MNSHGALCPTVDACVPLRTLRCYLPSACNPAPRARVFACSSGRDEASLMCSRCASQHFAFGSSCARCTLAHRVLVPILALVFSVFLFEVGRRHHYQPTSSALLHLA